MNATRTLGALLATVGLAACGSSAPSTSDFKKQFQPIDSDIQQTGRQLGTALGNASSETDVALAGSLGPIAAHLQGIVGRMEKIKAPSAVKGDWAGFQQELTRVTGDITSLASAVRAHSATTSRSSAQQLIADTAQVKPTENRIRKGVGLPPVS